MYKAIGAILILGCGLLISAAPLIRMTEHIRVLSEMIHALEKMKAGLNTNALTIPQLMQSLVRSGNMFDFVYKRIEQGGPMVFYDAWQHYIRQEELLSYEEQTELRALGEILGRYTIEDQLIAIERTLDILNNEHMNTKNKLRNSSRLYIGTGLSLSLMLVIALL